MSDRIYGIIAETKIEGPLIWEQKPLTLDEAYTQMTNFSKRPEIIRVAVFKIIYETGSETLIEKEQTP